MAAAAAGTHVAQPRLLPHDPTMHVTTALDRRANLLAA